MLLREEAIEEEEADGNDRLHALTLSAATARLDMAFRNDANGNNDEDEENDNDYDDGDDWDQGNGTDGPPRQHLASFMSGMETYIRETDLSKQVSDWQERLTPLLKQQDAHPPFDIHHYGREIIARLEEEHKSASLGKHSKSTKRDKNKRARIDLGPEDDEKKEAVPFETLADGKNQFEVAWAGAIEMQLLTSANTYEAIQA
ncbi:unnamed protein product [Peronospora destructor]|uniref:Condensin-2 complex subunit H2 C-terminal domain-containing protein n=1 Tax=Peronospora destructor TaxID=86335 RepID=A0AAV0V821_9STRA|nr:unnamed protein product [Peronospora destructor]